METKKITYETYEDIQNATIDRSMNSQIGMLEENQKACLIDFKNHIILRGLSKCTLKTYVMTICQLLRYAKKTAEQLTKEDIENFLISRQNLKQKTRLSNFITLKMFLKWLKKDQYISDIHIKRCLSIKLPEEMLTLDEIKRMIQVATNFRDKAIVFTLYETATRQGELLNLKIKHVSFDNHGAIIIIPKSKTVSRRLRVVDCVPDLKRWIDSHPARDDPEAPLWVNIGSHLNMSLGKAGLNKLVSSLGKRAGIKKHVFPHLFRHSSLTELAKQGFNESELRIIAGWAGDSAMPKVYIHLSGADVERKILEKHGLVDKEEEQKSRNILRIITCWRCKANNGASARFCNRCGADLDEEKRREERTVLLKGAKNIDVTNAEEMIKLGQQLIEMGKLSNN